MRTRERRSNLAIHFPFAQGEPTKVLNVAMVRDFRRKFFLGGYRHKQTGVEYHHAITQTQKPTRPRDTQNLNHRETQTAELATIGIDTAEDTSTQMTKIGAYVTIGQDRIMFASDRCGYLYSFFFCNQFAWRIGVDNFLHTHFL